MSRWAEMFYSLSDTSEAVDTVDSVDTVEAKLGTLPTVSYSVNSVTPVSKGVCGGEAAPEEGTASSAISTASVFPADASDWRDLYEERAGIREYVGHYTRDEAERLAWSELQNRWNIAHGERVPRDLCAGCRKPIGSAAALDLIDGNRVHTGAGHDCLISFGRRWRAAATHALVALGLTKPK